ncbi:putative fusaric acid resistance protein [Elsinoe fawcettii]|nr:putative fusaric acid resistance protein [Elsinoe fawcettii]
MPATAATNTSPQNVRQQRRNLRNSTIIVPSTGERVRREFTLPALGQNDDATPPIGTNVQEDEEPLLSTQQQQQQSRWQWIDKLVHFPQNAYHNSVDFITSKDGRRILKCSLAYTLGTCGTFFPPLSAWLGHSDGKHIVATVTVYFHAARTLGSMVEATICALVAFIYAAFLSLTSMGVSIFFAKQDMLVTGHAVVLFIFVGGGLGFVAWIKQRLGNPLVNVACSLASLASITVFVKEGSIQAGKFSEDKVVQVLKMVIIGIGFAALVNFLVFPERARQKLNSGLMKTTDLLGDLLSATTRAFLSGSEAELQTDLFDKTFKDLKASLKTLKTDLAESRFEHFLKGDEKQHRIEAEIVKCVGKLSQNLGGLRSAAFMQFDLIRTTQAKDINASKGNLSRASSFVMGESYTSEPAEMDGLGLQPINEEAEEHPVTPGFASPALSQTASMSQFNARAVTLTPADMFSAFISQLGPPMKSLVHTLKLIMDELPFNSASSDKIAINENFYSSLKSAIDLFRTARRDALTNLYRNKSLYATSSLERLADYEEIAASCGHFSFALIDLAEEIANYLDLLEDLKVERDRSPHRPTYGWLKFWRKDERLRLTKNPEERLLEDEQANGDDGPSSNVPPALRRRDSMFMNRNASTTPWTYRLWRASRWLHRDDIRFAGKVGIGAAMLAAPAFINESRPTFQHLRLEWGIVSYMVVCSMTIGAVNTSGLERFFGTALGAILAVIGWIISSAEAVPLMLYGWLVSLGCFYIIVVQKKGPMGRFIFLTYNLSALYAYSLSVKDDEDDDDEGGIDPEIWEIVLHRVISVMIGCLWAILITRVIWPISARKKLKEGICLLWLRMGLIWKRDPLGLLLSGVPSSKVTDIREEADLQTFLSSLDGLKGAAKSEFELRGPFPDKAFARILERTQRMLDNFHGMNVVITKNLRATPGEMEVLRYTADERSALSARISHLFSVLASTVKMEYPLNDVLPNIEHARDRLLARVFDFRRQEGGNVKEEDFEIIYAYVLATGQLAKDIAAIIKELELLYGTLNEDNFRLD